jgi:hypothetical protein
MKYKNAAGLFVSGISLVLAGPLIVFIAMTFGARAAFTDPSAELGGLILGVTVFGVLLSIAGIVLLVGSIYRALVKIDALPVMLPSAERESRSVDRW